VTDATDTDDDLELVTCPSCDEQDDGDLFGCKRCHRIVCQNCASGGLCEACDGVVNGTITVHFR